MEKYDIAVIGAGPAGSMAAKYAAKVGANVVLLEEHPQVGWPIECAGLIGWRALDEGELPPGKFVLSGLKGATVYSPNEKNVSFEAESPRAWVVDRRLFDRSLALEAVRAGADLRVKSHVKSILKSSSSDQISNILTLAGSDKIEAKMVISAEGVRCNLARKAGIAPPERILSGAQVEAPFQVEDTEKVEIHLGASSGLFAWVIPLDESSARIGLCTKEKSCEWLRVFLRKKIIQRRLLGSPVSLFVGGLPLGPSRCTVANGLISVGDAAGQVKPTSGGGIYPGLLCAKIAGSVAAAAALEGDCSAKRLHEYDMRWRAFLGRELEIGMRLNKFLTRMSNEELDEAIEYLGRKPDILSVIEEYGDIDRPSRLILKMLPKIGLDGIKLVKLLRYALG
ncbi:MAG: NAD(P)/FAD-dependent oxidoreductase [Methanotrichaceae archaeon]|nr:NAD(P)/FAD-dependent oxidoreductase [Methanotrichaceae archaeon]